MIARESPTPPRPRPRPQPKFTKAVNASPGSDAAQSAPVAKPTPAMAKAKAIIHRTGNDNRTVTAQDVMQAKIYDIRAHRKQYGIGDIAHAVGNEFEGKGLVAKFFAGLANRAAKPHNKLESVEASIASTGGNPNVGQNLVKDVVNLPANVVPSVYVPVAGALEAIQGRPQRLHAFLKNIDKHDAVFNLLAAGADVAAGDTKGASGRYKQAQQNFKEHPGYALAEAAGLKGVLGRGVGGAMRSGALGSKAAAAADTLGTPKTLEGTHLLEARKYSPDVFTKQMQKSVESHKATQAANLRAEAQKAHDAGNEQRGMELERKANRVDPNIITGRTVARRVDERVAANEDLRRLNRADITRQADKITKGLKHPEIVPLLAQNIVRASREDLRAYADELATEHDTLGRAGQKANQAMRRQIHAALKDPKLDLQALDKAATKYSDLTRPLEGELTRQGLLGPGQGERARLMPYAIRRMSASHNGERLVDSSGKPISNDEIRAHMALVGDVREPAYLSQAPSARGRPNYFISSDRPQKVATGRTGEATRKGTFDIHPESLREGAARQQGLVDATEGFRGFLHEFGVRDTNGALKTVKTKREADQVVRDLNAIPTAPNFRAIRVSPWGGRQEQLASLLEHVGSEAQIVHGHGDNPIQGAIQETLSGHKGPGDWAIVPERAAKRMLEHLSATSSTSGGMALQAVNSAFRKTVLTTSPSWLAGNVIEAGLRSAIAKAGPTSWMTGRRLLHELERQDPKAAREAAVRMVGGGHYSFAQRASLYRSAESFQDTPLEGLTNAMANLRRTPGPRHLADTWSAYTNFVSHTVNHSIERQFQIAQLGRAVRDSHLMDGKLYAFSQKAVHDAAGGLRDTNAQVMFGREIDRMYGKYGKFSPSQRLIIAQYTPFIAWYLNAVKFVLDVIPRDHPLALALIASSEAATEEWRKNKGLDQFIKGRLPGFLQGTLPTAGGGHIPASRYTPFGAFGDPLGTLGQQVIPLYRGPLAIAMGMDWKGAKLKGNPNTLQRLGLITRSFAESTVPVLNRGEVIAQKGLASLNPLNPIRPKAARPGGGGGGAVLKVGQGSVAGGSGLQVGSSAKPVR